MHFIYILQSLIAKKSYIGYTDNIIKRLSEHNDGKGIFTKRYKPWKIIHLERFKTKKEAIKKEKYFKSAAGRRWMRKFLFNKNAAVAELADARDLKSRWGNTQ
jgi:putative endonuclease